MSTRLEQPHEGCLFSAMNSPEESALRNHSFFTDCIVDIALTNMADVSTFTCFFLIFISVAVICCNNYCLPMSFLQIKIDCFIAFIPFSTIYRNHTLSCATI